MNCVNANAGVSFNSMFGSLTHTLCVLIGCVCINAVRRRSSSMCSVCFVFIFSVREQKSKRAEKKKKLNFIELSKCVPVSVCQQMCISFHFKIRVVSKQTGLDGVNANADVCDIGFHACDRKRRFAVLCTFFFSNVCRCVHRAPLIRHTNVGLIPISKQIRTNF